LSNSIGFNIAKALKNVVPNSTYAISFKPVPDTNIAIAALSDFSLMAFDVEKMESVLHIP